jgi:hypothetical protein
LNIEYFPPGVLQFNGSQKKVPSFKGTRQVFIFELTTQKFRRFALPYFDLG